MMCSIVPPDAFSRQRVAGDVVSSTGGPCSTLCQTALWLLSLDPALAPGCQSFC
jgi:hypothetical protein